MSMIKQSFPMEDSSDKDSNSENVIEDGEAHECELSFKKLPEGKDGTGLKETGKDEMANRKYDEEAKEIGKKHKKQMSSKGLKI